MITVQIGRYFSGRTFYGIIRFENSVKKLQLTTEILLKFNNNILHRNSDYKCCYFRALDSRYVIN